MSRKWRIKNLTILGGISKNDEKRNFKNTFSRFIRNRQLLIITTPLLLIFTLVIMWETIRYWGIFERSLIPSSEAIFLAFLRLLTKGNFGKISVQLFLEA